MFRGRKRKLPSFFIPEQIYHGSGTGSESEGDARHVHQQRGAQERLPASAATPVQTAAAATPVRTAAAETPVRASAAAATPLHATPATSDNMDNNGNLLMYVDDDANIDDVFFFRVQDQGLLDEDGQDEHMHDRYLHDEEEEMPDRFFDAEEEQMPDRSFDAEQEQMLDRSFDAKEEQRPDRFFNAEEVQMPDRHFNDLHDHELDERDEQILNNFFNEHGEQYEEEEEEEEEEDEEGGIFGPQSSDESNDEEDNGYYSIFEDFCMEWMSTESEHTVSKVASDAF